MIEHGLVFGYKFRLLPKMGGIEIEDQQKLITRTNRNNFWEPSDNLCN